MTMDKRKHYLDVRLNQFQSDCLWQHSKRNRPKLFECTEKINDIYMLRMVSLLQVLPSLRETTRRSLNPSTKMRSLGVVL